MSSDEDDAIGREAGGVALVDGADVGDPMFKGTGDEDITGVSGGVGEQDVAGLEAGNDVLFLRGAE